MKTTIKTVTIDRPFQLPRMAAPRPAKQQKQGANRRRENERREQAQHARAMLGRQQASQNVSVEHGAHSVLILTTLQRPTSGPGF